MTTPNRRGRPSAADREARIEAILDAATQVFLEQGYEGASTAEIARRAGASKTTLYTRFPTKAELFVGLVQRRNAQLRSQAAEITLDLEAPPEETLTRYGLLVLDLRLNQESRALLALFLSQIHQFPTLSQLAWAEGPGAGEKFVENYLRAMDGKGTLQVPHPALAARQFMGAVIGWEVLRTCFGLGTVLVDQGAIQLHVQDTVRRFLFSYLPQP